DAGPPGEEPSMTRKPRLLYSPDGLETTHSIDEDPTAAQAGFDKIHMLLRQAVDENASDVHLRAGSPPRLRIDGELLQIKGFIPTEDMMWRFFRGMMSRELIQRFERTHEADFSYALPGVCRLRINIYVERGAFCAAIRMVPERIPTMEDLRLPKACQELTKLT